MSLPPHRREPVVDAFGRILSALVLLLVLSLLGTLGAAAVTIALA
jgi:hypothetical protein